MTDLELYCLNDFRIGLLGSIYFLGMAISGIILKQADQFGRKKVLIFCWFLQIFCWYSLYFWRDLNAIYATLFIWGLSGSKNIIVYILCTETVPKKHQVYVGSFVLSIGTLSSQVPTSIYFLLGGKNIQHVLMFSLILIIIATIVSFIVLESPRYLYERKFFTQLRKNLVIMSRINGAKMDANYLFEAEYMQIINKGNPVPKSKNFLQFKYLFYCL